MSVNGNGTGFRPDELVKIQGREFVIIGGRLRVLHGASGRVSITTEVIDYILDQHAVVRARVAFEGGGEFTGTGVASAGRDPKLQDALVELAETRAIARALRFAGIGVECVGFEELGAGPVLEGHPPRQDGRPVPGRVNGGIPGRENDGGRHPTLATSAQRRALAAIAHRLGRDFDGVVNEAYPDDDPAELTLSQASTLIDRLRSKLDNGSGRPAERR